MKKIRIGFIISLVILLLSCTEKNKTAETEHSNNEIVTQKEIVSVEAENIPQVEEKTKEVPRREIKNPLIFYKQYDFTPVEGIEIDNLTVEKTDDTIININYLETTLFSMEDNDFKNCAIIYHNKSYKRGRQSTNSFCIYQDNIKKYDIIISLNKGFAKIYTSIDTEYNVDGPFYSGYSNYYLIYDKWLAKDTYYDYKTFKTIPASYDGEVLLIDINTDEIIYSIQSKMLHDYVLLTIDEVNYEDDGFRIMLGDRMDLDDFVDFKLYTSNNDFHYEIYDSYTYER